MSRMRRGGRLCGIVVAVALAIACRTPEQKRTAFMAEGDTYVA